MPDPNPPNTPENMTVSWTKGWSVFQNFYFQAGFAGIVAMVFLWNQWTHRADMNEMHEAQREDLKEFKTDLDKIRTEDTAKRQKANERVRELTAKIDELMLYVRSPAHSRERFETASERARAK